MTMIRINLIAEKKQGAAKVTKKATKQSPQVQQIQDNIIIVALVMIGLATAYFWNSSFSTKAEQKEVELGQLKSEYDKLKIWEENQKDFEIKKRLLDQKIQKISALKEYRGGPIKILEDIYNNLPANMWIEQISSGKNKDLEKAGKSYRDILQTSNTKLPSEDMFSITGFSKSSDAITNFTKSLETLDTRYASVDLSRIVKNDGISAGKGEEKIGGVYKFEIYVTLVKVGTGLDEDESGKTASSKKKKS